MKSSLVREAVVMREADKFTSLHSVLTRKYIIPATYKAKKVQRAVENVRFGAKYRSGVNMPRVCSAIERCEGGNKWA